MIKTVKSKISNSKSKVFQFIFTTWAHAHMREHTTWPTLTGQFSVHQDEKPRKHFEAKLSVIQATWEATCRFLQTSMTKQGKRKHHSLE